jgi:UDP-3-O-[3-hydroxymyristoyl] glucosamine N-acyltransferase
MHKKSYRLADLAELLDATLVGDGQCEIIGLATLKGAKPGQLSFLSNPSYAGQLAQSEASAVILEEEFADSWSGNKLVAAAPYVAFCEGNTTF